MEAPSSCRSSRASPAVPTAVSSRTSLEHGGGSGRDWSCKVGVCELGDDPCYVINDQTASHGRWTSPELRKKKV